MGTAPHPVVSQEPGCSCQHSCRETRPGEHSVGEFGHTPSLESRTVHGQSSTIFTLCIFYSDVSNLNTKGQTSPPHLKTLSIVPPALRRQLRAALAAYSPLLQKRGSRWPFFV